MLKLRKAGKLLACFFSKGMLTTIVYIESERQWTKTNVNQTANILMVVNKLAVL